jgi:Tol biopolymer transport system component
MSIRRATPTGSTVLCALVTALCALLATLAVVPGTAAAEECPNAAFRTGPATHLPDCRAYELVSPANKNEGAPILDAYSPDGLSAMLTITAGTAGLEGFPSGGLSGPEAYYTTKRTSSGWTTVGADPPSSEYLPFQDEEVPVDFGGHTLDGLTTLWKERAKWQPDNGIDIFERLPDHSIVDVGPGLPPTAPAGGIAEVSGTSRLYVQAVSSDASHTVFSLEGDYWPFDSTQSRAMSLYEYAGTGNTTPTLVGVNESGALISKCGTELGSANSYPLNAHNAMSRSGKTVFFTAKCGARTGNELYARIDNGEPGARTVDISEPSPADCAACDTEAGVLTADARFEGASQDGSKMFFSTTQPLMGGDTSHNLYEYDSGAPAGERVVRVSGGASHAEVLARERAQTVISEDGSHIYFLASSVLTSTPNGEGEAAEAGANNLYMFERDASYPAGRTEFVARLSKEDLEMWAASEAPADVTPDGRFLVFESERDLTPDDTSSKVRQIFEYDAQTGALTRVSIGQDGFNNNGNVPYLPTFPGQTSTYWDASNATIVTPFYGGEYSASSYSTSTSVSADGSYVFFESTVGLTPQALDRKVLGYAEEGTPIPVYANNVYEYHDGRVSLISDGQDLAFRPTSSRRISTQVKLLGTDESGQDVLFTTADKLVGQDTDTTQDIYDARIDGGFPAPAVPPACSGESCQGTLSGAPTLLSPGSEFQAGGNPPLAAPAASKPKAKPRAKPKRKCKRGTTRKHDKCVKGKSKSAKQAGNKRRAK